VLTQATMQKHICHSISSTINFSKDIDVQTVANVYETAWKEGIKGITVYREGARDGILQNKDNQDKKTEKIIKTHAPKRPIELPCDIFHIKVTKKLDKVRTFDYMVMVGVLNGNEPYEVFAIENGKFDHKIKKGKIIKETRGRYHLICENGVEIKNITKDTTENEDALTRLTSTAIRHGADIKFIVEQLGKVEGTELFSFAKSIARALKHYIKEGTESSEKCPKCNVQLVFENGCFICKNCGNSKCS
jgi:ribonucleoside-diphosphate reductase alpha chain